MNKLLKITDYAIVIIFIIAQLFQNRLTGNMFIALSALFVTVMVRWCIEYNFEILKKMLIAFFAKVETDIIMEIQNKNGENKDDGK